MALTQDQLYNLAVGDEVIVHGKCEDICSDGDIRVNSWWTVAGEQREQSFLVHYHYVSLPPEKPKYDPCRLFRAGDKVRVVEWNGRKLNRVDMPDLLEVEIDEHLGDNDVSVFWKGSKHWGKCHIQQCYLELVTPVEEESND